MNVTYFFESPVDELSDEAEAEHKLRAAEFFDSKKATVTGFGILENKKIVTPDLEFNTLPTPFMYYSNAEGP